jgi:hypothetical protein
MGCMGAVTAYLSGGIDVSAFFSRHFTAAGWSKSAAACRGVNPCGRGDRRLDYNTGRQDEAVAARACG